MLQPKDELIEFIHTLCDRGHTVEMFTNGTMLYPQEILNACFIIMDWKLAGSGEADNTFGVNNSIRIRNFRNLYSEDVVKFTIADENDFEQAFKVWDQYWPVDRTGPLVYAGVVWGKEMTNARLVELILKNELPWRLNIQVHNYVWDRSQRGI